MAFDENAIANFNDLTQLLDRDGVFHKTDEADLTVQIPTQRGTLDSVILVRWQESDGVIQFIQAVPLAISDEKLPAVVDAVTRMNHVLAVPGFDMNHARKLLAYRLYLPIYPRGSVKAQEIQAMFRLAVKTASDFLPVFARVVSGEVKPEDVVAEAQKAYSTPAAGEAQAQAQAQAPDQAQAQAQGGDGGSTPSGGSGTPPAGGAPPSANMY